MAFKAPHGWSPWVSELPPTAFPLVIFSSHTGLLSLLQVCEAHSAWREPRREPLAQLPHHLQVSVQMSLFQRDKPSLTSYLSFSLPVSTNLDFATQDGIICLYLLTGHLFKASGSLAFWGLPGAPEPLGDSSRLEVASVGWHSALPSGVSTQKSGWLLKSIRNCANTAIRGLSAVISPEAKVFGGRA